MRDILSEKARRARADIERVARDAAGIVAVETSDEVTGQHDGEELAMLRSRRPTPERIDRLERKHDALAQHVTELRVATARIEGQVAVLPGLIGQAMDEAHLARQREHLTFSAQLDVDRDRQTAEIEVAKASAIAEVRDAADTRKARRTRWTKLVGVATKILGLLGSGAVLHFLGGKLSLW